MDRRARLRLPVWLRLVSQPAGTVLVAAGATASVVVITATTALDGLGDLWAGEKR